MSSLYDNNVFNLILLMTIIGEFLIPWILKHFYKEYDSKRMVMSALGSPESPVRKIYNIWLIWLGIFLLITAFVMFLEIKSSSMILAILIFAIIVIFAIGAGLLAGIFSVNESKDVVTVASKIHGVGSAIGFMMLIFFPLLSCIIALKNNDLFQGIACAASFILALLFFIFFIMGDKKELKNTVFSYEGLWERLTLFFMYVPFLFISLRNLLT